MSKDKSKKLVIRSEKLRNLSIADLKSVAGGLGAGRSLVGACNNSDPNK